MAAKVQRGADASADSPGGFWARQNDKDRIAIVTFGVQLLVSVVLMVVGLLLDKQNTVGRFAILAGNLAAVVGTLQFAISKFFDTQKDEIDSLAGQVSDLSTQVTRGLEEMRRSNVLGETLVKIFRQDEAIKRQYQNTLDAFLLRLSNCIDDRRSGALDIMDYYGVLEDLASKIGADFDSKAQTERYAGEVWALSFLIDDEWDDTNIHEMSWFDTLRRLDQKGVPTRRLWAFDKKMLAYLRKEPIDEDGKELIRRLALYCADSNDFTNTTSFAVPKTAILDEHVRLFGKGFFAAAFDEGNLSLIRGVCFDNLLSNSLGGEIDFDDARVRQIRLQWERYLVLAKPLQDYVREMAGPSARAFMDLSWASSRPQGLASIGTESLAE